MSLKIYRVEFSKFAAKQILKLPLSIKAALEIWRHTVELTGLLETRKLKGYHDEPLKGRHQGERSVRLNRAYRLIYKEFEHGNVVIVGILEVNKHDY